MGGNRSGGNQRCGRAQGVGERRSTTGAGGRGVQAALPVRRVREHDAVSTVPSRALDRPPTRLSEHENDVYFGSRPRASQLGAWASPQSEVIPDRSVLEARYEEAAERFGEGDVPRPENWGGFCVVPERVEFWQGRLGRLHDRLRYRRTPSGWAVERLAP